MEVTDYSKIEMPDYLQKALDIVIEQNPQYGSIYGAQGKCIEASDKLLFCCDEITGVEVNGYLKGDDRPHSWAYIEGLNVDLTARQFGSGENFPKIWIN